MKQWSLGLGPIMGALSYLLLSQLGFSHAAASTSTIAMCCIIWWIFEPIPIPVTSLLPLATFPLLGVLDANQVASAYGSKLILLLLGGFILSTAMSHSGAHRRIALGMVNLFGNSHPKRVVFGFASASALLSMWISNTATTLMLLPIAVAVVESSESKKLAIPLFLAIAYSASVGGIGTPIGTPPNLIFMQVYEQNVGESIGFLQWMSIALPFVVLFVPVIAFWLTRNLTQASKITIPSTGQWTPHEKRVLIVFAITAFFWVTRSEPFGGWSQLFNSEHANDASVALLAVIALFLLPDGKGNKLLTWEKAQTIPWGVLLLFGGGICLAKAFIASGLSDHIASSLTSLSALPVFLMILLIALAVSFLTEATSNTATTALLMPVLAAAALGMDIDPTILMIPAAMSASCAFMLPVATAPNSVIYGSGVVTTKIMAREGFLLNICAAVLLSFCLYFTLDT